MNSDFHFRSRERFSQRVAFRPRVDDAQCLQVFKPEQKGSYLCLIGCCFNRVADLPFTFGFFLCLIEHNFGGWGT